MAQSIHCSCPSGAQHPTCNQHAWEETSTVLYSKLGHLTLKKGTSEWGKDQSPFNSRMMGKSLSFQELLCLLRNICAKQTPPVGNIRAPLLLETSKPNVCVPEMSFQRAQALLIL